MKSLKEPDIQIDLDEVMAELLEEGIDKFAQPFQSLMQSLENQVTKLSPVSIPLIILKLLKTSQKIFSVPLIPKSMRMATRRHDATAHMLPTTFVGDFSLFQIEQ